AAEMGVTARVRRAPPERHLRGVRLHGRRLRREKALVQRDRALAVAREALRLSLREQKLAPRIDRVAGFEISDRRRVVARAEALESARVQRRGLGLHRTFDVGG